MAVEADFAATYRIDLREACYGPRRIGARRLRSLLMGLPRTSAFRRDLDPAHDWSWNEELLASLLELVDHQTRLFIQANTKKGTRLPKELVIKRPWEVEAPKPPVTMASDEEIRRFFGGSRA